MMFSTILEKLMAGYAAHGASFAPRTEPTSQPHSAPTPPATSADAPLPAVTRPGVFELVLAAYVTAPGGD